MASISNEPNGRRTIQFVAPDDGKRRSIRLGKVPSKKAEEVKLKVEAIVAARATGLPIDGETAAWLRKVGEDLYDRLAGVGLVEARGSARLAAFIAAYVEGKTDLKEASRANLLTARDRMVEFFGTGTPLQDITRGDADEWLIALKAKYAPATAARTILYGREFFRAAVRRRLVDENPFAEMRKLPGMSNPAREFFVTREMTQAALDACPTAEWRLIVALARYGGLRVPSELIPLTWDAIDWARERMRIISPKTAHHEGGGERLVPIFPELRPFLVESFELAPEGAVKVVERFTRPRQSAHNVILDFLRKAGVTPWPRLYQNLRSSRETELAEQFPMHVVCAWIGNSPRIAAKHYLQVTDDHFQRAASGGAKSGAETSVSHGEAP